jgi:hypothetical protein
VNRCVSSLCVTVQDRIATIKFPNGHEVTLPYDEQSTLKSLLPVIAETNKLLYVVLCGVKWIGLAHDVNASDVSRLSLCLSLLLQAAFRGLCLLCAQQRNETIEGTCDSPFTLIGLGQSVCGGPSSFFM